MTSTPVPTPIVVGTPEPTDSPTPAQVVDAQADRDESLARVTSSIERAREDFPGTSSIHFLDIATNQMLDYGGEKQYESASLMKLVVIAEIYRRIHVGELEIEHPLILEREQIVGGSGDLKKEEPGQSFTVEVLVEKMITQSDNTATQMLTDFLSKDELNKSTTNLGLTGTSINRDIYDFAAIDKGKDNYITAIDAAKLLEQLAREQLPGSKDIHAILERQQRNDMIGSGFPEDVKVAHKTGELNGILHDVGIVYAPRGAYVLVLLSEDVTDKAKAVKVWSRLSQEILEIYQVDSPSPTPAVFE